MTVQITVPPVGELDQTSCVGTDIIRVITLPSSVGELFQASCITTRIGRVMIPIGVSGGELLKVSCIATGVIDIISAYTQEIIAYI